MAGEEDKANRTLRYVVAAVVLLVVGVGAYLLWPRPLRHVLVVGDSVSYMSLPQIEHEFGGSVHVEAITRPGYRTTDLLPLVTAAVDQRKAAGKALDRAVFLVGYNDAWHGDPETTDLNRLIDVSARYDCVVWLAFPARPAGRPPSAGGFDPDKAVTFNARLRTRVGQHDNLHLVTEWADVITKGKPGQYLMPDGIHPNAEGALTLARIMHDSIRSSCRFA